MSISRKLEISNAPPRYENVDDMPAYFGKFGGRFIPETLVQAHLDLEKAYIEVTKDPSFIEELEALGRDYVGRPTPLYEAKRFTAYCGGAKIWLKREDLAHTGAHKINNALGQALLAKKMGKTRIIAETGAGQHGVATATACALLDLPCVVYMGERDIERQSLNVFRMKMLGATVIPAKSGSRTLKDACNEAIRDWVTNVGDTHYIIGSAIGSHPFPTIVRDFQACLGNEARAQMIKQCGGLPDAVVCCVGGGSNAIGMYTAFVKDEGVKLYGVEAGGDGVDTGKHSSTLSAGRPGVLHGTKTYLIQDPAGQIVETHSISAGLDYPGVGPEHAHLKDIGRVEYVSITDKEALDGFAALSKTEGIIPALEPSHALAYVMKLAKELGPEKNILMNCCGRGDKDMLHVAQAMGVNLGD